MSRACVRAGGCACACRVCVTYERPCCGAGVRCIQPASPEGPMTGVSTTTIRTVSVCAEGCTSSAELHGGSRVGRGSAGCHASSGVQALLSLIGVMVPAFSKQNRAGLRKQSLCSFCSSVLVLSIRPPAAGLGGLGNRLHHDGASVALIRKSRGPDDPENSTAVVTSSIKAPPALRKCGVRCPFFAFKV